MSDLLVYFVICLYVLYQAYKQPLSLGFTNYPYIEFMIMYLICMLTSYNILRIITNYYKKDKYLAKPLIYSYLANILFALLLFGIGVGMTWLYHKSFKGGGDFKPSPLLLLAIYSLLTW